MHIKKLISKNWMPNYKNNCLVLDNKIWKINNNRLSEKDNSSSRKKELDITMSFKWYKKWKAMDGKIKRIKKDDYNKFWS